MLTPALSGCWWCLSLTIALRKIWVDPLLQTPVSLLQEDEDSVGEVGWDDGFGDWGKATHDYDTLTLQDALVDDDMSGTTRHMAKELFS